MQFSRKNIAVLGNGASGSVANATALPVVQSNSWCTGYNFGLGGVQHVKRCENKNEWHVAQYHKCAVCGEKGHGLLNCRWVRAVCKLTRYTASAFSNPHSNGGLPRSGGGGGGNNKKDDRNKTTNNGNNPNKGNKKQIKNEQKDK